MCWIIPLIVGVISAVLGYLLGKQSCDCENSPLVVDLRQENENLKMQLGECEARKRTLVEEQEAMKISLAQAQAGHSGLDTEKVKGKVKGIFGHFSKADEATESEFSQESPNHFISTKNESSADTDKVVAFDADLAKSIFGKKIKQDDLTIVEGIGPKIAELFHNEGIKTWKALANTPVDRCQEILTAAGSRFAIHTPDTWPRQAKMAYEGKWQELLNWQEALDGGVEV